MTETGVGTKKTPRFFKTPIKIPRSLSPQQVIGTLASAFIPKTKKPEGTVPQVSLEFTPSSSTFRTMTVKDTIEEEDERFFSENNYLPLPSEEKGDDSHKKTLDSLKTPPPPQTLIPGWDNQQQDGGHGEQLQQAGHSSSSPARAGFGDGQGWVAYRMPRQLHVR